MDFPEQKIFEEEPIRKFAFITDEDVFFVIGVPDIEINAGILAGLVSSPTIVDVTAFPEVSTNSKYINGEFYNRASSQPIALSDDYELED